MLDVRLNYYEHMNYYELWNCIEFHVLNPVLILNLHQIVF